MPASLRDVRNGGDLNQRVRFYQPALNAEPRRFIAGEELGVDFVNRGVVFPVGDKDAVEGHVLHGATRRFDHGFDRLQHVAGLRLWVVDKYHVVVFIKRQRAGDTTPSARVPGTNGAIGVLVPGGMITDFGIVCLLRRYGRAEDSGRRRNPQRY